MSIKQVLTKKENLKLLHKQKQILDVLLGCYAELQKLSVIAEGKDTNIENNLSLALIVIRNLINKLKQSHNQSNTLKLILMGQ